ncbi:MAG: circularly permuted type 2 ATP-grasp protein [Chloroflexota bacterium]|nr:circularly permuted type 2 ATP-grasp protein [Chloroflexota bacterium]MYE24087.1 circularly permuted type 2 ATP-grasp protein [Gammaproteobacteria bacterium]
MTNDLLQDYPVGGSSDDEMFDAAGAFRSDYRELGELLHGWSLEDHLQREERADLALLSAGITFNVYSEEEGTERIFPFSLLPRIVGAREWQSVEAGLRQRLQALNLFLSDIYGARRIIKEHVIPEEIVLSSPGYKPEMADFQPPLGVYAHVAGCDLVRDPQQGLVVLEDNLRTPSGVSYVIENRTVMLRVVPDLFPRWGVRAVADYPNQLMATLLSVRPPDSGEPPRAVLLTPGIYNSAYFEHSFLSNQMGIPLVEGSDLTVGDDDFVYLRSTTGLERVDVVYRRIDDDFLDPRVYRADSMLGVPGLMRAYLRGHVTLVNAPGAGVADDKVVYRWVPEIIRFYLGEEPLLSNVETFSPLIPAERDHIRAHARELVIKPANESGGYGVLIGEQASSADLEATLAQVEAEPRNWIAQPRLEFTTIPTLDGDHLKPRRADLRPFVLSGEQTWVIPGGLTRVALREGSYIVNSSQGGGSKDTWVLNEEPV